LFIENDCTQIECSSVCRILSSPDVERRRVVGKLSDRIKSEREISILLVVDGLCDGKTFSFGIIDGLIDLLDSFVVE